MRAGWIVKGLRDRPTNRLTDTTGYRGALTHLKQKMDEFLENTNGHLKDCLTP